MRILGRTLPVKAEVIVLNGLSTHANHDELLRRLAPLADHATGAAGTRRAGASSRSGEGLRAAGFADVADGAGGEGGGVTE